MEFATSLKARGRSGASIAGLQGVKEQVSLPEGNSRRRVSGGRRRLGKKYTEDHVVSVFKKKRPVPYVSAPKLEAEIELVAEE
ncbi:unnamed protein product [Strongylus vulgaris]|uniref:Uncharacterized protein n=1 Tax=Strongylus vulgaris TaxID=40348 RepID=A0A3P7KWR6_STRVU|nr:unnamed protein product [Strongylus vulgaris]